MSLNRTPAAACTMAIDAVLAHLPICKVSREVLDKVVEDDPNELLQGASCLVEEATMFQALPCEASDALEPSKGNLFFRALFLIGIPYLLHWLLTLFTLHDLL